MHNFGNIKNTFNKVLSESIIQKDRGRKTIFKEYLKTLRESTILKSQFIVLTNIESKFIEEIESFSYSNSEIALPGDFRYFLS